MASKRKSTVPCMIPSKSKHVREEIILGSLPELLPTIPEDSILSISGEESAHFSHSSSKTDLGNEIQKGGTYSCPTCHFESRDLNYFLDHMHNCHLDFRAQPTFYCLNCGVSVVRFEGLALHNANVHPRIMEGLVTASLTVNKRDGVTTVEQSLFTNSGEDYRESAISLTKTPIAKMMKAKGEHKKFVVSHTVEVRKIDTGKDVDPNMLSNVPELQNGSVSVSGAPAMPRTSVTHVVTKTVSNQVFHQHTPSLYSPSSSDSNKDLPKVMIPLSSIPTYDAAMDTSSFLKTSFGKFPYPTKAELCYLTVVSEFPEEQIKLWFTAQRLKQGISWSPEEIEEARRKMFNTVFQGGAPQKLHPASQHGNHIVTHYTAHPGSKGPNYQMPKVPFGNLKSKPAGILSTETSLSSNPHVTRVSYSTPIVPAKFPPIVRTTQGLTKNTQHTVEPGKTNGLSLDIAGGSGCASSTSSSRSFSSSSSYSTCTNGGDTVTWKSPTNSANSIATHSTNISNNNVHCVADNNDKPNVKSNTLPIGLEGSNGINGKVLIDSTSNSNVSCDNGIIGPQEESHATKNFDDHNSCTNKTNNSSINSDYPSAPCNDSVSKLNHASKSPMESTSTTVINKSSHSSSTLEEDKTNKDLPVRDMSILPEGIKEDQSFVEDPSGPELKMDPIKIYMKRVNVNESESNPEVVPQELKSDVPEVSTSQLSFSPPWGNKTPQQLQILRQVFSSTRWPSSQQYEELSIQTGLPKSEVVRWFSDSRYSHKNGQLKWLDTYQRLPTDSEEVGGNGESLKEPMMAKKKITEQDMSKHLEGEAGLNSLQQVVWQDSYALLRGPMGTEDAIDREGAEASTQPGVLQDPWSERAEEHQQPVTSQSLIKQQTDTSQARERRRMELLEV